MRVRGDTLTTIDEFMASDRHNAYVDEPGWRFIYMRKARRMLDGQQRDTIDLANFEVLERGKGTLKALIERLRRDYPDHALYVDRVLNDRLANSLPAMGFTLMEGGSYPPSFYRV